MGDRAQKALKLRVSGEVGRAQQSNRSRGDGDRTRALLFAIIGISEQDGRGGFSQLSLLLSRNKDGGQKEESHRQAILQGMIGC